jgi:hypothetical protein
VVNDDVVGLDIPVHDAVRVAEVKGDADLVDVVPNVKVTERRVQYLEICVLDALKDQAGRLGVGVSYYIQQLDDIRATTQVLEDFDLTLDFLFLDWFEDLDHASLVIDDIDAIEDLRVFAAADLTHDLVVLLVAPVDDQ